MRVCLVASSRFPIAEPFAGGLEAMTHTLARQLSLRGHDVTLFAGSGSDPALPVRLLTLPTFAPSEVAMRDRGAPDAAVVEEHHAYLDLMFRLAARGAEYDVVHNNSLHHLPVAMAPFVPVPVVTTLHTPPLPMVESAAALTSGRSTFTTVSAYTAASWAHVVPSTTIRNGIDLATWRWGHGGGPAVWSGRIVAEKAPHEAIDACRRARVPLVLAGPVHDVDYLRREIEPRLGGGIEYRGHLPHRELAHLLRTASAALVTPAWDEPYGLVAAEAMACGTPVVGYARGALPEVVSQEAGVLVVPGDVDALSDAVRRARLLDRAAVRRHAERTCSLTRMVDEYEQLYASLVKQEIAA